MLCYFPEWLAGIRSWSPGLPAASYLSCLAKKGNPKKAPPVRRRCAGPCSGASSRGCATRPGGPHKAWPAAELEQCSPNPPLACTRSAGRRTGVGALRSNAQAILLASPPPVRHRAVQAGQGKSDAYVRARGRARRGSCEFTRRPGLPSSAGQPRRGWRTGAAFLCLLSLAAQRK